MEIIKQGKIPTYKVECHVCGTIFRAEHKNLHRSATFITGHLNKIVDCPCCNTEIEVSYLDKE